MISELFGIWGLLHVSQAPKPKGVRSRVREVCGGLLFCTRLWDFNVNWEIPIPKSLVRKHICINAPEGCQHGTHTNGTAYGLPNIYTSLYSALTNGAIMFTAL